MWVGHFCPTPGNPVFASPLGDIGMIIDPKEFHFPPLATTPERRAAALELSYRSAEGNEKCPQLRKCSTSARWVHSRG